MAESSLLLLVGTAAAVRFVLGVPWDLSLVIGSLLVATGPTVVTPILRAVPVRGRVAAALETEGIVNDVTAAILAVVFFNRVNPETSVNSLQEAFVIEREDMVTLLGRKESVREGMQFVDSDAA